MKVILSEKPSVARDIARVLGARKRNEGYLEGNGYQITWAFGHLVELAPPDAYDASLKSWSLSPLPFIPERFKLQVSTGKGIKKQFKIIKNLLQNATEIICATDAGREGELIFRNIAQLCRVKSKPALRLWISSLTDSAIRKGFADLRPLNEFNHLADAARCRAEADWIIGLNTTRAYTVKHSHGRGVLSVGRVQTPVLAMIVNRDQRIRNFQPEDYWELWTCYRDADFKHYTDRFKELAVCKKLYEKVLDSPLTITNVTEKQISQMPPKLFDLTQLQRVMNRKYGLTAQKTLVTAQELYERKLITYPRTDSCYLTDDVFHECAAVLSRLSRIRTEEIDRLDLSHLRRHRNYINSAKVTDHHAIIPTGELPAKLSLDHQHLFDEVVTRFIAIFYPPCEKAYTTVDAQVVEEHFIAKGTCIIKEGWLALYGGNDLKENQTQQILPEFAIGESGTHLPKVKKCRTKPPKHFTEATLLTAMETAGKEIEEEALQEAIKEKGLGTPATRAGIIEILVKRDYIQKRKKVLLATAKGEDLIRLLSFQQTLISPELTGEWEYQLKGVEKGRISVSQFMAKVTQFARQIITTLNSKEANVTLGLGPCPLCGQPVIKGKTGFGCSAWRSGCPFRFQAEQYGTILTEKDIPALLTAKRLSRPRKLQAVDGSLISGYITLDQTGNIGILGREAKVRKDSVGRCPLCNGNVLEKPHGFVCDACEFIIWKKIAGRKTSQALAKLLLTKGRSRKLKGFRTKAGKPFSAVLFLKAGKVEFEFKP
ncbi:MAG: DNA topoisomerase 3 [Desulfobacteraceae bacterium]